MKSIFLVLIFLFQSPVFADVRSQEPRGVCLVCAAHPDCHGACWGVYTQLRGKVIGKWKLDSYYSDRDCMKKVLTELENTCTIKDICDSKFDRNLPNN